MVAVSIRGVNVVFGTYCNIVLLNDQGWVGGGGGGLGWLKHNTILYIRKSPVSPFHFTREPGMP